jgi:branched-subunit amino acid transport protein
MNEAILILGMTAVTFGARYPVLAVVGRLELSRPVGRALCYVPVAVLTAISVPSLLMPAGEMSVDLHNAHLIGGIVAALVSWRTRHLLWTIVAGMGTFLAYRWALS